MAEEKKLKVKELRREKGEKRKQIRQTMATKTNEPQIEIATAKANFKKAQQELKAETYTNR